MHRYPTPTKPGFYWAKLVHPNNMPPGEDWKSTHWEVVAVWDNNSTGDEALAVHVPGLAETQWIPDFIWGPQVTRPEELK